MTRNTSKLLVWVMLYTAAIAAVVAANRLNPPSDGDASDHFRDAGNMVAASRSPDWPAVRAAYLKGNPVCEACGSRTGVEVHHVVPFSENSALELDVTNLITLCRGGNNCHFRLGHRCDDGKSNWTCENPQVRDDAARNLMRLYGPK